MKVGDIVRQHGKTVKNASERLGVVLEIKETPDDAPEALINNMKALTGRSVTVMWDSGVVNENFAEKMLEVVVEPD